MKAKEPAAPVKTISLPSLPRCDEANRSKWIQEYDRVEGELLRPHMSGSATLGLRLVPQNFDRAIPPQVSDDDVEPNRRPKSTVPFRQVQGDQYSTPRPLSAKKSRAASTTLTISSTPTPFSDSHQMLRMLFAIVDPPIEYRSQLDLNLRGIDLRWIAKYVPGDRTPVLQTLETLRDDAHTGSHAMPVLNSPRSVIVMLRNGVTVDDLQIWPLEKFCSPSISIEESQTRHLHREERRLSLIAALREEYRETSSQLSLFDLLDEVTNFRHRRRQASPRSRDQDLESVRRRREEHQGREAALLAAKQRSIDEKMAKAAQALASRAAAFAACVAEKKRRRQERQAAKALQSVKTEETQAESSDEEAVDTQPTKASRPPTNTSHELRKKYRLEKNRELVDQQRLLAEERRIAKEQAAAERRSLAAAEARLRHEASLEQRRKAEESRLAAQAKAKLIEEQFRAEAEAKAARAAERLEAFASFKLARARQHAIVEMERRQHAASAALRANENRISEEARIRNRQESQAARLQEMNRARDVAAAQARLTHLVEQDDKFFFVERQRKAHSFDKLVMIADLVDKQDRAASVLRSRSPR